MRRTRRATAIAAGALCATLATGTAARADGPGTESFFGAPSNDSPVIPNNAQFENPAGRSSSFSQQGQVNQTGSFFQKLGTNDRTCNTCHLASDGWTISARSAKRLFNETGGLAALFQFDGQNCRNQDLSTVQNRRIASSVMLAKALVRFDKTFPAAGEIEIVASEGTYCNPIDASNHVVYRRPLPVVNFGALSSVLWDGRGTGLAPTPAGGPAVVFTNATRLHAQAMVPPTPEQVADGAAFMAALNNAQIFDDRAGRLDARGGRGGAEILSLEPLVGAPGFNLFDAWLGLVGNSERMRARAQIARGQVLFNTLEFAAPTPSGVGTCAACHNVPNQGNGAAFGIFDIGTSDAMQRTPDLPLYTLRNKLTGETRQTSDAGAALATGLWADIGKFKVPMLRGLASRAPYFHNGTAEDLESVVDFYDERFEIGLTLAEREDLVAFLRAL